MWKEDALCTYLHMPVNIYTLPLYIMGTGVRVCMHVCVLVLISNCFNLMSCHLFVSNVSIVDMYAYWINVSDFWFVNDHSVNHHVDFLGHASISRPSVYRYAHCKDKSVVIGIIFVMGNTVLEKAAYLHWNVPLIPCTILLSQELGGILAKLGTDIAGLCFDGHPIYASYNSTMAFEERLTTGDTFVAGPVSRGANTCTQWPSDLSFIPVLESNGMLCGCIIRSANEGWKVVKLRSLLMSMSVKNMLQKYKFNALKHIHIWYVSPQLSWRVTCSKETWVSISKKWFDDSILCGVKSLIQTLTFNAVEIRAWVNNFIHQFCVNIITYPCLELGGGRAVLCP